MAAPHETISEEALADVLDRFYAKVRRDDRLGPVFARAIPDEAWPAHLMTIRDFWSSVMLRTGRYKGNPFGVHLRVDGISPALFARWLHLFDETCRERLAPTPAAALSAKAVQIAQSLQAGLFFDPARRAAG